MEKAASVFLLVLTVGGSDAGALLGGRRCFARTHPTIRCCDPRHDTVSRRWGKGRDLAPSGNGMEFAFRGSREQRISGYQGVTGSAAQGETVQGSRG